MFKSLRINSTIEVNGARKVMEINEKFQMIVSKSDAPDSTSHLATNKERVAVVGAMTRKSQKARDLVVARDSAKDVAEREFDVAVARKRSIKIEASNVEAEIEALMAELAV